MTTSSVPATRDPNMRAAIVQQEDGGAAPSRRAQTPEDPPLVFREKHSSPTFPSCDLSEFARGTVRPKECELRRLVVREVRLPALLVGRQPNRSAFAALRHESDGLSAHRPELIAA